MMPTLKQTGKSLPHTRPKWQELLSLHSEKLHLRPGTLLHFGLWLLFQSKRPSLTTQYLQWCAEQEHPYV